MTDQTSPIGPMKAVKIVAGFVLAFFAWVQIDFVSGNAHAPVSSSLPPAPNYSWPTAIVAAEFLAAVIFLHWLFYNFLIPTSHLSADRRRELILGARRRYGRGDLNGIVALGYLVVALEAWMLWLGEFPIDPGFGLFLIFFGTLLQVRAVILNLTEAPVEKVAASSGEDARPTPSIETSTSAPMQSG